MGVCYCAHMNRPIQNTDQSVNALGPAKNCQLIRDTAQTSRSDKISQNTPIPSTQGYLEIVLKCRPVQKGYNSQFKNELGNLVVPDVLPDGSGKYTGIGEENINKSLKMSIQKLNREDVGSVSNPHNFSQLNWEVRGPSQINDSVLKRWNEATYSPGELFMVIDYSRIFNTK